VSDSLEQRNSIAAGWMKSGSIGGSGLDERMVHMEQTFVQQSLDTLRKTDATKYDLVINQANASLNPEGLDRTLATRFPRDAAYVGILDDVRKHLGRKIDFQSKAIAKLSAETDRAYTKNWRLRCARKGSGRMQIVKRFAIWVAEILGQGLLLSLLLIVLSPSSTRGFARDLWTAFIATVVVFMFGSGYLLSTAIVGIGFRGSRLWLYPVIAALLFVIHEQVFFSGWTPPDFSHLATQVGGACIVFFCTLAGSRFLRNVGESKTRWRCEA
jgi:hypothetical protein